MLQIITLHTFLWYFGRNDCRFKISVYENICFFVKGLKIRRESNNNIDLWRGKSCMQSFVEDSFISNTESFLNLLTQILFSR